MAWCWVLDLCWMSCELYVFCSFFFVFSCVFVVGGRGIVELVFFGVVVSVRGRIGVGGKGALWV